MNTAARSGDVILNTLSKVGLVVALLSPFIKAGLTWVEAHTPVVFGDGYQTQLETAIGLAIPFVIGTLHMRRLRAEAPTLEQSRGNSAT